jgi:hypothetical protein
MLVYQRVGGRDSLALSRAIKNAFSLSA